MKYIVSNQERPNNSPLYSIHTNLDSFIPFNDDIPKEKELISEGTSKAMITQLSNIPTTIDEEENGEEIKKKSVNLEIHRKQITGLEVQNNLTNNADNEK